ncbi:MAG: hypothetical protein WBH44_06810 [Proteocatella sp.]
MTGVSDESLPFLIIKILSVVISVQEKVNIAFYRVVAIKTH